jgi:enoyl-CoA hydratase
LSELVQYAVDRAIATVTLDSPENRNALSAALVHQTSERLREAALDDDVRAVVLTHTGSTFCSGADLREATAEGGPELGTLRMLGLLRLIVELPKPVVGRVDGAVRAGGLGIVGACDIVVASRNASFAFTEARLGLAPAIISLTTLDRLTERAAARYYLTGDVFDASAAQAAGLITIAADDVDAEVEQLTASLRLCSPQGLAETKPLTTHAVRAAFAQFADEVQAQSSRLFASAEAKEGMLAFLEKRPPQWAAAAGQ